MKKLLLLCVLFSLGFYGCGSDSSSTSGSLSVSAPTASNGVVTAVATFSPSSGSALPGQEINFRWYTVSVSVTTKIQSSETPASGKTDKNGIVTSQFTLPVNRSESYIVYVIASTSGLTNKEGWQSVMVAP